MHGTVKLTFIYVASFHLLYYTPKLIQECYRMFPAHYNTCYVWGCIAVTACVFLILLHSVTYRGWSANNCTLHDHQGPNLKCDVASFPHIILTWIVTCYANFEMGHREAQLPPIILAWSAHGTGVIKVSHILQGMYMFTGESVHVVKIPEESWSQFGEPVPPINFVQYTICTHHNTPVRIWLHQSKP